MQDVNHLLHSCGQRGEQSLLSALLTLCIAVSEDYFKGTGLREEHFSAYILTAFDTSKRLLAFMNLLTNSKNRGQQRNCTQCTVIKG
jgi:hypothetical protein